MARVKSTASRKHRKVLKAARGFKHARRRRAKLASEALLHAGEHAFRGRKLRKRDLRALWIVRINAALKPEGISYSKFMSGLAKSKIDLNRKVLADIAVSDPEAFKEIVAKVK